MRLLSHDTVDGGNRCPVRIGGGMTERGRHALNEIIGRGVLEALGFVVHAIPGIPEDAGEIRLEDAMTANGAQRRLPPAWRELHAAIRHVIEVALRGQPTHHAGY